MSFTTNQHASAETLQAFLEGHLPAEARAAVERHLTACARCAAELDAWRTLLEDLDGLAYLRPEEGFAERVMAGVEVLVEQPAAALVEVPAAAGAPAPAAPRLPLAARIGRGLRGWLPRPGSAHVTSGVLQDLLEGELPARRVARVEAHLAGCAACAADAAGWRAVFDRLAGLPRLSPAPGFTERVLVRMRAAAPAAAPVPAAAALAPAATALAAPRRVLSWAGRFVPQTRRAWAALSGIAVTPAVTAALLLYAVFSHPTLTPDSLLAFLWWQVSDLAAAAAGAVGAAALQSGGLLGLASLLGEAAPSPLAVAGALGAYVIFSALALRVLYKNLIARRPMGAPRPAHASVA